MRTYQRLLIVASVGALIIAITALTGCQKKPALSNTEARLILDRYLEMINEAKPEIASQVLDSGFMLETPMLPEPLKGVEAFKNYLQQNAVAFPDYNMMLKDFMVEGERIWFLFTISGTNKGPLEQAQPTGKDFNVTGIGIATVSNQKLQEMQTFWNSVSLFQQLGFKLMPPQPGTQ
jgi:predicted ester cyclase